MTELERAKNLLDQTMNAMHRLTYRIVYERAQAVDLAKRFSVRTL